MVSVLREKNVLKRFYKSWYDNELQFDLFQTLPYRTIAASKKIHQKFTIASLKNIHIDLFLSVKFYLQKGFAAWPKLKKVTLTHHMWIKYDIIVMGSLFSIFYLQLWALESIVRRWNFSRKNVIQLASIVSKTLHELPSLP